MRVKDVHETHRAGENWQRQASMELTGFGVGGAAGMLAGKATVGALTTIGLAAGPVGWLVVLGVGVVAGFGAAYALDRGGKSLVARIWDRGQ